MKLAGLVGLGLVRLIVCGNSLACGTFLHVLLWAAMHTAKVKMTLTHTVAAAAAAATDAAAVRQSADNDPRCLPAVG